MTSTPFYANFTKNYRIYEDSLRISSSINFINVLTGRKLNKTSPCSKNSAKTEFPRALPSLYLKYIDMNKPGAFALKCRCCNNPWQASEGGNASEFGFCEPCIDKGENKGLDPKNLDLSVSPSEDFYSYSNGGWKKANPCPDAYPRWGVFNVLNDMNQVRLKSILDEIEEEGKKGVEADFEKGLLIKYHKAYMDTDGIEKLGIAPVVPVIESIQNMTDITSMVATLWKKTGSSPLFGWGSMPSKDDSSHTLLTLDQGGLGLPDRDYYFESVHEEKRFQYIEYLESLFKLVGEKGTEGDLTCGKPYATTKDYREAAKAVFEFEKELASAHLTKIEHRDPIRTWNMTSFAEMVKRTTPTQSWSEYLTTGVKPLPGSFLDLSRLFTEMGFAPESLGDVNCSSYDAITKAIKLASPANAGTIKHYLIARLMKSYSPYMSDAFHDNHFSFWSKKLQGVKEVKERWKRALDAQMNHLSDCMGKIYAARYFNETCRAKANAIVDDVKQALRERLNEVDWMSEETRKEALIKMENFNCKIGYPEDGAWIDYTGLELSDTDPVANAMACNAHLEVIDMNQCNKATRRDKWLMPCQMINAYYHPMLNEIVFPAAILQPPFFDIDADDAVQFGSLGCIAGHEMTHGFDDKGRKYDAKGRLRDWWAGDDGVEYEKRAKVMIEQADKHMVFDQPLKGALTVGENIADLGGVKLALRALRKKLEGKEVERINGFTPVQRFCLSWSQAWRQNARKEFLLQMVTLDPHGPSELRANNTLSNVQDFVDAFDVKETDKMYIKPADRVDIW